ncbi:MAG: transporter substrate-binding domain-containing protein [Fibrobacteraceae bacterium]
MNLNFKILFPVFLAVSAIFVSGCSGKDETPTPKKNVAAPQPGSPEAIQTRGKLIVGVFGDIPPFGYVDSTGKNVGFDIAYAHRFAKDLLGDESKIEFVTLDPANRIEYLKSDKVDIVIADFTVTEERKKEVDFSLPYSKVAVAVIAPAKSKITKLEDLKGRKLLVNKGTTAEIFFTQNYPDVKLVKFDQNTALFQALKDGRGEALSQDNTLLFAWAKDNPGYKVVIPSVGSVDQISVAVKKGNKALLDWVNAELVKLGKEKFGHTAYEAELKSFFSSDTKPEDLVVEGGAL